MSIQKRQLQQQLKHKLSLYMGSSCGREGDNEDEEEEEDNGHEDELDILLQNDRTGGAQLVVVRCIVPFNDEQ